MDLEATGDVARTDAALKAFLTSVGNKPGQLDDRALAYQQQSE